MKPIRPPYNPNMIGAGMILSHLMEMIQLVLNEETDAEGRYESRQNTVMVKSSVMNRPYVITGCRISKNKMVLLVDPEFEEDEAWITTMTTK